MLKTKITKLYQAYPLFIFGCLSLASLIMIYWPGLFGPFLLDDLPSIAPTQLDSFSWSKLLEITTQNESGPLGRPLSILSFALNHLFFGPEPLSFKVVNVLLHFTSGLIIAWLCQLLLSCYTPLSRHKQLISFLIAFVWLIHPLQVSTVLYAVQRMTILTQLFCLLACCFYVRARLKQINLLSYKRDYVLCGIAWILGLLAKETALLLPLFLFTIEVFIIRLQSTNTPAEKRFFQWFRICILLGVLVALCLYRYQMDHFMALFDEKPFSLMERVLTECNAIVFYIRSIYLPALGKMSLYHDDFPIARQFDQTVIVSITILALLISAIFVLRRRAPLIAFGLTWFFVSHLLESTILPLELVFEHRNYLGCLGLILVPICFIAELMQQPKTAVHRTYPVLGCIFIALLMSITWQRAVSWSSTEKFLHAALLTKPNSARTHIEFANWLMTKGAYELAYFELLTAQTIQPTNTGIDLHILLLHCQAEYMPPVLLDSVQDKIQRYPITPYVILGLDKLVQNLFQNQCHNIPKSQVQDLLAKAHDNPYLKNHPRYKAVLYHLEAGILLLNDSADDATMMLLRSFETYPKRLDPLVAKATLELNAHNLIAAEQSIELLEQYKTKPYAPREIIQQLRNRLDLYNKSNQQ